MFRANHNYLGYWFVKRVQGGNMGWVHISYLADYPIYWGYELKDD
jgi:hypothetical protein